MCGSLRYELSNNVDADGNTLSFVSIQGDALVLECDQLMEASGEFTVHVEAALEEFSAGSPAQLAVKLVVDPRCAASQSETLLTTGSADDSEGVQDQAKLTLPQVIFVVVAALVIFGIGMCIAYLFVGPRRPASKPDTGPQSLQMANQGKADHLADTQQLTFDDMTLITPK